LSNSFYQNYLELSFSISTEFGAESWNMSKEDYAREAEKERYHMDNYRQYILEQLKICPQIRDTVYGNLKVSHNSN